MSYIQRLDIVLKDNEGPPSNAVTSDTGSNDLNKGMGGKYAYLVATRTNDKSQAARWFDIQRFDNKPSNADKYVNYAEGAKGGYRYIITKHKGGSADEDLNVVDVKLFRSSTDFPDFGAAWSGYKLSADLNSGRGGDYLYLGRKYAF